MLDNFKLVLHIGAGKTGSSSIQKSFRESKEALSANGIEYWGQVLELAPTKIFEWQNRTSSRFLFSKDPSTIAEEVTNVVLSSIKNSIKNGITTAIWSNEWFFRRHESVLPTIVNLSRTGIDIAVVLYLRGYDSWAKSSYVQWGLRHKSYTGPIIPFNDFLESRPVEFYESLSPWLKELPNQMIIKNYDACDDVVNSFESILGLEDNLLTRHRVNVGPSNEELFLNTLFNNTYKRQVRPGVFENVVKVKKIDFENNQIDWMKNLLPKNSDLNQVVLKSEIDLAKVNKILIEHGEPELELSEKKAESHDVNITQLVSILSQMSINQAKRIFDLEKELSELKEELGKT